MEFVILALLLIYPTYRLVRFVRMRRYFDSDEFLAHKDEVATLVADHNEVASYTSEIRGGSSFKLAASQAGAHAHLASFENTSEWNYRRDRNTASYAEPNVHNCSLAVVRSAKADPLKYLMKYFGIRASEAHLAEVESLGEEIARLEGAVANLHERETAIAASVNPPRFILRKYQRRFMEKIGLELSPITVPYPTYVFQYVSAGGNSSQETTIWLNTETIDALVELMATKIRWRKSAAGQRALMTARLRETVKVRDNHTCQHCGISTQAEPHLLLEIDHIMPVSRGGTSTLENLQTLCWRCNRTKSNKLPA